MSRDVELLTEIRDLLLVLAEPALAKRDEKLREALRSIVGRSDSKTRAVLLMDGSRSQSAMAKEAKIDPGQLSRLVKALGEASLLASGDKLPKLMLAVPKSFFEERGE